MKLFRISVWGPCETEQQVQARRTGPADGIAFVSASTKAVANDICYFVSNMIASKGQGKDKLDCSPNYQMIDELVKGPRLLMHSAEMALIFDDDELLAEVAGLSAQDRHLTEESVKPDCDG
jgi:hypothetical protein